LVCYVAYTAKYLTYLLKSTEVIQIWEFDNLYMTQCAKIIVGFMANVGNIFYPTFTNVFLIFSTFFLRFFKFSSQRLLHLWFNMTTLHCNDRGYYSLRNCGNCANARSTSHAHAPLSYIMSIYRPFIHHTFSKHNFAAKWLQIVDIT